MIKAYTDGACPGNSRKDGTPGGWAWYATLRGNWEGDQNQLIARKGGSPDTTNNRMELKAICNLLHNLFNLGIREETVCIHTDSLNAINWLTGVYKINDNFISEFCWAIKNWRDLGKFKLVFIKVKGHSGECQNEYVDKLAVQAANDPRSLEGNWSEII